MRKLLLISLFILFGATGLSAEVPSGVYQTAPGDSGGWLHVRIASCANDTSKSCGQIIQAFVEDGSISAGYEHLGKAIVWGMEDKGNGRWGGGKIWAPDRDKIYNSKMRLEGNQLIVEGCIAFICRAQTWEKLP